MDEAISGSGAQAPSFGLGSLLPRSDEVLARRAARGDRTAFAAIFRRYQQDLYRYCHSILRNKEDAQDALQSTMASALRSLPGEGREIALRPWLFRVAHNHAITIARARRHAGPAIEEDKIVDHVGSERVEARARLRTLLEDLSTLTERRRAALTMRELSGLAFEEIGAALEISPQAARQSVYEARVALRELEAGRAMDCDRVTELVSGGDRRALRARGVRAHLRACRSCRDFRRAIETRSADLRALSPPLGALAVAALAKGALDGAALTAAGGSSAAGAAGAAGVAGKGLGASLAVKATASVVAATAIGVGAANYAGLIDGPLLGGDDRGSGGSSGAPAATTPASPASGAAGPASRGGAGSGVAGQTDSGANSPPHANGGGPPAHSSAGGNPPAHSNAGGNPPAHSNAGGGGPPAHSSAGGNPPAHSNAGGNPPAHSNAGGGGSPEYSNAGGSESAHGANAGGRASAAQPVSEAGEDRPPK